MPPKNVAAVLNNESNLRILERLKARPYYPRELAAEMKLSEPFIVRRLKAMEEYDIVEGRWETEDGRRIKRYYVKDVTMQLGKGGLEVTAASAPARHEINMLDEALKLLMVVPFVLLVWYGIAFGQPVILAAVLLVGVWHLAINLATYRYFPHKTVISSIIILILGIVTLGLEINVQFYHVYLGTIPDSFNGIFYMLYGMVFIFALVYHIRFSQYESAETARVKGEFVDGLESAPITAKLFYLPMAIKRKLYEYFGLA